MATAPIQTEEIVTRCHDAAAINAVCNHPAVLPGLSLGMGELDVGPLLADTRNVAFLGEYGGALFHHVAPRVYAAHDFFLPQGRGPWALAASRFMLKAMFDDGTRMIFAETPVDNKPCKLFNRWLGFKSEGVSRVPLYAGAEPTEVETFVMGG